MSEKFKKGSQVKLATGGPAMTVNNYFYSVPGVNSTTVVCKWFVGTKLEEGKFDENALVLIEQPATS